jgi:hypothetical protein
MKALISIIGGSGVLILIGLLWCLTPMIVLWSFNVISEEASLGFYIPHTVWTYICTLLIVFSVRGSSSS